MLIDNSKFSCDLRDRLLYGEPACSFSLNGKPVSLAYSSPVEIDSSEKGHRVFERSSKTEDGLSVTVRLTCCGGGVIYGMTIHNDSDKKSARISDVAFCNLSLPTTANESRLLYNHGSLDLKEDFCPLDETLHPGDSRTFANVHGRSSEEIYPYFNLDLGDNTGFIAAIGWSGHWTSDIARKDTDMSVRFTCPNMNFRLNPGETAPLPWTLILPWEVDVRTEQLEDAFNAFRRFMLDYILPANCGRDFNIPVCMRAWGSVDPAGHAVRLENIRKYGLRAAVYGIDAGWYEVGGSGAPTDNWYTSAGDWQEAPNIFPNGIKELADNARELGMGFWLWCELERAVDASFAAKEHPEMYLCKPKDPNDDISTYAIRIGVNPDDNVVNMADPEARDFIFKKIARLIDDTKMSIFRIDYNFDPELVFRANDGPERDGLTELHYYNGLYALFERLLTTYPNIIIDNCASGGRRHDFRMCLYSVPIMCSSDYFCAANDYDPEGIQGHTWGISRWYPVSGDSVGSCMGNLDVVMDTYRVRSSIRSCVGLAAPKWKLNDEEGAWYQKMIEDIETITPLMKLDHYPLTPYTLSDDDWLAFERCDYEGEKGLIMAFRRKSCETDKMVFALSGLLPNASYRLWDIDDGELGVFSGKSLAAGYEVCIPEKRQAKVILFTKM